MFSSRGPALHRQLHTAGLQKEYENYSNEHKCTFSLAQIVLISIFTIHTFCHLGVSPLCPFFTVKHKKNNMKISET